MWDVVPESRYQRSLDFAICPPAIYATSFILVLTSSAYSRFPDLIPSSLLVLFPPFLLLLPNNPLPYAPSSCSYNIHNLSSCPSFPSPLPVELSLLNLLIFLSFFGPRLIISR